MQNNLLLIPAPRKVEWHARSFALPAQVDAQAAVKLTDATPGGMNDQAYRLTISTTGIEINAASPAGQHYARQTLAQIARQCPGPLPCVEIEDWPDFPNRGVMLDISRDKVPTMATLKHLIDLFSELKYNQLQLYTEHTFTYRNHPEVWANASPLTAEEIKELEAYSAARFIELVPNQNSFGHMERWLKHPRLTHLAETPDAVRAHYAKTPFDKSFSICPLDPGALQLLEELYAELLPNFSSHMFNVGCDETFELGQGRSREACEQRGKGRVYLDFLLKIYELVKNQGRTMMFWGDIIMQHPELIAELPRDVIALEWGYEADHPFEADTQKFAAAGIPFYVCPGTSSWNSLAGRTNNAVMNLCLAAKHGLANGAVGYLVTDWGDNGHWQYLPVSYLGFAAGAAFSWCLTSNARQKWPKIVDAHILHEQDKGLGKLFCHLGNACFDLSSVPHVNGTIFSRALLEAHEPLTAERAEQFKSDEISAAQDLIGGLMEILRKKQFPQKSLERRELQNTILLMQHALKLIDARRVLGVGSSVLDLDPAIRQRFGSELKPIIAEHRALWLGRNRPGGLRESTGRLERILDLYNAAD